MVKYIYIYIYSHDVISNRFFDLSCFPWFPDSRQKVCQSSFILGVSYKSISFNLTSVHLSLVNNDRGEMFLSQNNLTIMVNNSTLNDNWGLPPTQCCHVIITILTYAVFVFMTLQELTSDCGQQNNDYRMKFFNVRLIEFGTKSSP